MTRNTTSRRNFLQSTALAAGGALLAGSNTKAAARQTYEGLHLACNQYPWLTFYRREGRDFEQELEIMIGEVAASGAHGFEPLATSPSDIEKLAPFLEANNLEMRSLYVNSTLHEADAVDPSINTVLEIAARAKRRLGTRIIVTNPSPIAWGGPENKSDEQLRRQSQALNRLGEKLLAEGQVLAYHNHDIELRQAAREFHHMLAGTDPRLVTFCLDAHWVFRGSGNSNVALFDVVKLYGRRVTELHLRQSRGGVWTESFGDGDIDYHALASKLLDLGVRPHLVLEQAVEKDSPNAMTAVEAHRKSNAYAARVFAKFAN